MVDPPTYVLGDVAALIVAAFMLLAKGTTHRECLPLRGHERDTHPGHIILWLLLQLELRLTYIRPDEVGHEPCHGQHVA